MLIVDVFFLIFLGDELGWLGFLLIVVEWWLTLIVRALCCRLVRNVIFLLFIKTAYSATCFYSSSSYPIYPLSPTQSSYSPSFHSSPLFCYYSIMIDHYYYCYSTTHQSHSISTITITWTPMSSAFYQLFVITTLMFVIDVVVYLVGIIGFMYNRLPSMCSYYLDRRCGGWVGLVIVSYCLHVTFILCLFDFILIRII